MNEFFKHAIENSNLDYKATAIKFGYLNEELSVTIPQIIKHIKVLKIKSIIKTKIKVYRRC